MYSLYITRLSGRTKMAALPATFSREQAEAHAADEAQQPGVKSVAVISTTAVFEPKNEVVTTRFDSKRETH